MPITAIRNSDPEAELRNAIETNAELVKRELFFHQCWDKAENKLYYLRVASHAVLSHVSKYHRLVIDDTFGTEAEQARQLIEDLRAVLAEAEA